MTTADPAAAPFSDDLTMRVLAITGVDSVFPPTATAARLPHLVQPSKVVVSDIDGTTVITARIATRRESHTPQTARQVADALIQRLLPGQDAAVSIQIAQIT